MLETAYVGKASVGLNEAFEGNPSIYFPGRSTAANVDSRRVFYAGIIGAAIAHRRRGMETPPVRR